MKLVSVSGGPCTGKTRIIEELEKRGYVVLHEVAREVATIDKRFVGKSVNELNRQEFQDEIFKLQKQSIENLLSNRGIVFSDRGLCDSIAYCRVYNLDIPKEHLNFARNFRYAAVFILEPLNSYKKDELRTESEEEQKAIQNEIIKICDEFGYNPVKVSCMSVEERADFILGNLRRAGNF